MHRSDSLRPFARDDRENRDVAVFISIDDIRIDDAGRQPGAIRRAW
jgi:hypothetical protein